MAVLRLRPPAKLRLTRAGLLAALLLVAVRLGAQLPTQSPTQYPYPPAPGQVQGQQQGYPGAQQGQFQNPLQDPNFIAQLRLRIAQSGLTPDQIRDRLSAEGYPSDLLEPYLPGAPGVPPVQDSVTANAVLSAVTQIGLIDSTTVDSLRGTGNVDSLLIRNRLPRDSTRYYGLPIDSSRLGPISDTIPLDDSAAVAMARRQLSNPYGRSRLTDTSGQLDTTGGAAPPGGYAALLARERERRLRRYREGADTVLTIFGLSLFEHTTSQFLPNLAGPVDESYRLGPGDQLVLVITGQVEIARTTVVTRDGYIVIPQVGQLYVANLSLGQVTDLLYDRLGRVYSGIRRGPNAPTHFSISIGRMRSNQVYVVGDVVAPGSYQVSGAGTAMSALYAALGPSVNGSLRHIEVRRAGRTIDSLDVYDYLLHGDASRDARLQNGDIVFVPVHGPRVVVTGQIVRPDIYEMKAGETLRDAIANAGGFTASASRRRVQITRILAPGERAQPGRDRVVIDISSDALLADASQSIPLAPGDSIAVFPVSTRLRNRIAVRGNVWSPGAQGFTDGERLSDAIKLGGGIKPDTYLGEILVTRLQPDSTHAQLRTGFRDSTGAPVEDMLLHEDDEIQVFSLREFRPRRYVAIAGAVRKGGRFTYRDGMTLRDLVLLGGGVLESADLEEAEIARLPESRANGVTAVTSRVPLDSTYLFERGPDGKYLGPPGVPAPRGNAPEVILRPYDNVLILRQPDWALQRTVELSGEVRYPGRYSLRTKTERLHDVIVRAGGLTAQAYAGGIVLVRKHDKMGRIGVDLPRVMRDPSERDNLILQDGDSLFIPLYTGVVKVGGEVNAPTGVAWLPGANVDYYIRSAGGPGAKADQGRAYVIQPDGKIESVSRHLLLFRDVPEPGPGSTVYVPTKYESPTSQQGRIALYALIAQVIGSIATVIAIARP